MIVDGWEYYHVAEDRLALAHRLLGAVYLLLYLNHAQCYKQSIHHSLNPNSSRVDIHLFLL